MRGEWDEFDFMSGRRGSVLCFMGCCCEVNSFWNYATGKPPPQFVSIIFETILFRSVLRAGLAARLRQVGGDMAELRGVSHAVHAAAPAVSVRGVKPKTVN